MNLKTTVCNFVKRIQLYKMLEINNDLQNNNKQKNHSVPCSSCASTPQFGSIHNIHHNGPLVVVQQHFQLTVEFEVVDSIVDMHEHVEFCGLIG